MLKQIKEKLKNNQQKGDAHANYEGQLAVDVFQTKDSIVIQAPIAGVKLADISIAITDDVLTIRGERKQTKEVERKHYMTQECYWGAFSRSIILPEDIDKENVKAKFKDGILSVTLAKGAPKKQIAVED
ncbi:MAG: Hsp20/alpha crystallin family protein [Candidatus Gracilibacteria bacterium]|nr:Hsp20/alpha crystallin family protein [Candidatus Gracilibacteria bacterium]